MIKHKATYTFTKSEQPIWGFYKLNIKAVCQCLSFFCSGKDRSGYLSHRELYGAEFHFGRFLNVASVIHQCIVANTVYLSVPQLTPSVNAETLARQQ